MITQHGHHIIPWSTLTLPRTSPTNTGIPGYPQRSQRSPARQHGDPMAVHATSDASRIITHHSTHHASPASPNASCHASCIAMCISPHIIPRHASTPASCLAASSRCSTSSLAWCCNYQSNSTTSIQHLWAPFVFLCALEHHQSPGSSPRLGAGTPDLPCCVVSI